MSTAISSRAPRARLFDFSDVGTAQLLGGIIVLSFLGRLAAGWIRATPTFFPDEYLYAELGRSIAEGSGPLVRDAFSGFPSLLHPLLTAPFWLIDDVETAFRAIQAFDAALMSLAALPAFAIARQLDLPRAWALLVAGSALLVPDLLLSSWLVAEPLAYPLVLASVWACARAIRRPSALNQLALLSLLGLTTLARFQLVVVPIAVLATFVVVGVRERRPIRAVREQWLVASVAAASLALGAVLLGTGQLGPYSGALKLSLDPIGIASWAAPTALVLAYATGWLVIPGALIGLVVGIARPKSRAEGTVCVLTLLLGLGLLAQAGFVSNTITADLHERYVFYLSPLLAISFGTWLHRGAPGARWYAALVTALGLVAFLVPLSRYSAAEGKTDSAFLRALGGLENLLADVGTASAVVSAASILGCVAALLAYRSGTAGLRLLWIGALIVGVATSAGAVAFDRGNALRAQRDFVGSSPSWIDRLDVDQAPLLWAKDGRLAVAHETLFWNRSVDRVVLLPEAKPVDNYAVAAGSIDRDGTLRDDGKSVSDWLLVDGYASTMSFRTGVVVGEFGGLSLYRFVEPARLESQFVGRFFDGWLAPNGHLTVWPTTATGDVTGQVEITLSAPANGPDRSVTFTTAAPEIAGQTSAERAASSPDVDRTVLLAAGTERTLVFAACSRAAPWRLDYVASPATGDDERTVTVRSSLVFKAASSENSATCLPRLS